jgi:magnesium chelatase family protein
MLVTAMNPCPCGFYGDPARSCTCSQMTIQRYQKKISGPLLDRIDIHLEAPRVEFEKLADRRAGEASETIRQRVTKARALQTERYGNGAVLTNADMGPTELDAHVVLDAAGEAMMKVAVRQLNLSARSYHRVLKLSRTIADLAGSDGVETAHVAEALQFRPRSLAGA